MKKEIVNKMYNNFLKLQNKILIGLLFLTLANGCTVREPTYEETTSKGQLALEGRTGSKLRDGAFFEGDKNKDKQARDNTSLANLGGELQVNRYLWTASIDIISFLPLLQVDAVSGVIITDWHALPEDSNKRYKVNVIVTGTQLRPDALNVTLFKQERRGNAWRNVAVNQKTTSQFEESILTRAREIRFTSLGFQK